MRPTFFKGVVLGAVTSILVLTATVAVAGTGVGDVFNLGETNTVDRQSALIGATPNAELFVRNDGDGRGIVGTTGSTTATGQGVLGRVISTNPVDPDAAGVRGMMNGPDKNGYGVWGSHAGGGTGVYGTTTGGAGVLGSATTGNGVTGQSVTGIGIFGITTGGAGVVGRNNGTTRSVNGDQPGVSGNAFADDGGQFVSAKGNGLCAASGIGCSDGNPPDHTGVYAKSTTGPGIISEGSPPLKLLAPSATAPPLEVNSTGKVANLNADLLDGLDSSNLLRSSINAFQTGPTIGKDLNGGTCSGGEECFATVSCSSIEHMLSGGFDFMDPGTALEASAPVAANTWRVQWRNNSTVDSLNLRILCTITPQ